MYNDYFSMMNPYMGQNAYQPKQEVVKVNGENGARAYMLGANSSALLLDESGTIVWLVISDGAGYKTVSAYDISPHETKPTPDFESLDDRIKRLEEFVNGFTADITATVSAEPEHGAAEKGFANDKRGK